MATMSTGIRRSYDWEANDDGWGPQNGNNSDFTLVFSNVIFAILPAVVLLAVLPFHLRYFGRRPKFATAGRLYWARLGVTVAMLALEVARSVVWCKRYPDPSLPALSSTSISAAVLCPLATLGVVAMVHAEFFHSMYSSSILGCHLSLWLLLDAARTRSFWLRSSFETVSGLSLTITLLKFVLVCLLEMPKTLIDERGGNSKTKVFGEAKAGFWNRSTVFWVYSIFMVGFRNELTVADLGTLGPDYSTRRITAKFEPMWQAADQKAPNALLWVCLKTFIWRFSAGGIPRVAMVICGLMMPVIAQRIIFYLSDDKPSSYVAGGLVAANGLAFFGFALFTAMEKYCMNRFGAIVRAALVAQLVKKNLRLTHAKAKEAAAMSLMSTDVEAIVLAMQEIHSLWTSLPMVGVGLYLMRNLIGNAFFLPLFPIIVAVAVSGFIGNKMAPATAAWNQAIQERVAAMAVTLSHIKGIKMISLDKTMAEYGQGLRDYEVEVSKRFRRIRTLFSTFLPIDGWGASICVMAGGTLWTVWKDGIDNATVWPALAFIDYLSDPVLIFFTIYPQFNSMLACFQRVQDFLASPEHEDCRHVADYNSVVVNDKEASNRPPAIKLSNVNVRGKDEANLVLKDLDFSIAPSTLCMVVGTVGTGKTVLLKTMLGETVMDGGVLTVATKYFAYCDQTAWLPDQSIRNVIVGDSAFEEGRYREALEVCSLVYDLGQLPGGDKTMVGHNGARVSGGQKQRLALARAVYSLAPVVLCDDILSALDATTSAAVFDNVFGPAGILKRQNRTAILATHAVEWLPCADQVIVLEGGTAKPLSDPEAILEYSRTAVLSECSHTGNGDDEDVVSVRNDKLELELAKAALSTQSTNPKLYSYMLYAVPRWMIFGFCFGLFLIAFFERLPNIYVRIWVALAPHSKLFLIGMAVIGLFSIPSNFVFSYLYQVVIVPIMSSSLHRKFIDKVMAAKLPFITSTSNGALLNRFSQDMTLLGQEMPLALWGVVYTFSFCSISVILVLVAAQVTIVFVVIVFAVFFCIQVFYLRTSKQMRLLDIETKTPLFTSMSETLAGLEHIRSYGWQEDVIGRCTDCLDQSQIPFYMMMCIQRWLGVTLNSMGIFMGTGLAAIGIYWAKTTNQSSLGLALVSVLNFTLSAGQFVSRWTLLETSLGAVARLKSFEDETPVESDEGTMPPPASWPLEGVIEFVDVSSKYSTEESAPLVLKNVSLRLKAGQKVIVVGRTGSGKSTMILTLLRFLEMTGSITIDGVDLSKVPRHDLRKVITTIPQDSVEILGSVRDNILPFSVMDGIEEKKKQAKASRANKSWVDATEDPVTDATREESLFRAEDVKAALKQVGLLAHVEDNGGVDKPMKDMHFSAGQKQLFNLARAILHQQDTGSRVVLMDEVTSNMDYETDVKVQEVLDKAFGDCTRIIISHRGTGYTKCDVLVTMHEGRIVRVNQMHGERVVIPDEPEAVGEEAALSEKH